MIVHTVWADLAIVRLDCGGSTSRIAIGFTDDYQKVVHKRICLTARAKLGWPGGLCFVRVGTRDFIPRARSSICQHFHPDRVVETLLRHPSLWPLGFCRSWSLRLVIVFSRQSVNLKTA